MKKKVLTILIAVLLIAGIVYASSSGWVKCSSTQSASALITAKPGLFHRILFVTNGTNANTVNIYDYDSASASGNKLIPTDTVIVTSATNRMDDTLKFNPPIRFYKGIYVTVDSTIKYMVYWEND